MEFTGRTGVDALELKEPGYLAVQFLARSFLRLPLHFALRHFFVKELVLPLNLFHCLRL